MAEFRFQPSPWVPFRDTEAVKRAAEMGRDELERHRNPDFRIRILPAEKIVHILITDIFARIRASDEENRRTVLILPNPFPDYWKVAHLINTFRVDCRNLWIFAMDEYADEEGRIAPPDWPFGFVNAMNRNLTNAIDRELRPPEHQVVGPTDRNFRDYSRMIEDLGSADACYSGPGWTGHLAFIEPDAPEFAASGLEEWMGMGSRIVTLSPFTLAQNSLHGSFGKSGNLAAVPPKAFTIGPADVVKADWRMDVSSITVHGTTTSWQRMITRLAAHGPVTPEVPTSVHQLLRTDFFISEENALPIEPDWDKGY